MIIYGANSKPVDADSFGNLKTRSIVRPEINDAADQHKAYAWVSAYTTAGADEEIIYIKNDAQDSNLKIHSVIIGSAVNAVFTFSKVTGTAGGTTITGTQLNLGATQTPEAISYGNASVTGLTIGDTIAKKRVLGNYSDLFDFQGSIILPPNTAIAVTNSGTGDCDITIVGHFNSLEG